MLVGQAFFIASDSVVKLAGESLPATQIMALRGVIAVSIATSIVAFSIPASRWKLALQPMVAMRASLEACLAGLFLLSLPHIALGNITVIMQITPLVITLLSAIVLREAVGWRRWLAIGVGFAGVILVAQPTTGDFNIYVISAIAVAILVAVRDLMTRRLDHAIPTAIVTFTSTISVCLLGFAASPLQDWQPVSLYALMLLAASATLVTLANVFIIRAFRAVEVSVVSPFRYFSVVWAILLGYAIWADIPNTLAIAGMLLIVGSGLYTMHRERLRRKTQVLPNP